MKVSNILFATDLSARCDRALERATKLAAENSARLTVAHAVQSLVSPEDQLAWRQSPDPLNVARRKVQADVNDYRHLATIDVLVEHAEPAEMILDTIQQKPCDLIITGTARDETGGRVNLGATVNTLVHQTSVPVLVVKSRARNNYDRIVVATDFSEGSRSALEATAALFPHEQITLFHAFDVDDTFINDKVAARDAMHRTAMEKSRAFLAEASLDQNARARIFPVCEHGYVGTLLSDRAQADEIDLVVLGTESRSGLAGFLLGSAAQRLATELPVDVLLVRRRRN